MSIKCLLVLLSSGCILIGPASAAGERAALKDSHVARFNAEDLAMMNERVMQALKSAEDGQPLAWNNDKSRASGQVTALSRVSHRGLACRKVRIVNTIGTRSQEGVYRFCQTAAGRWKLDGPDKA